ncbi:TonB-dependent receptor [Fontimonas sp. SYSU GA230001]|uniref:TonB-dependent receptor n=1 Tax=Fontimonas sp. SYSU GA230001 TaxID=3142450 RepID=UPI0032B5D870
MKGFNRGIVAVLALLIGAAAVAQEDADDAPIDDRPPADEAESPALPTAESLTTIAVEPLRAPAPPPAASDSEEPRQIEEIVVTAQKTRQSLQKVPISVTAVGGEFIAEVGAQDLAEVSLYVPNVRVDSDDLGSPQMFIRGFGTNSFNPSFEASVGLVQDEIYYGRAGYFTESMFDVDRVEVLRGPQGTLFGKNTVAGVFNVSSVAPEGELTTTGRYTHGSNGAQRLEAAIGGDLGDWGGARAAVLWRRQDGEVYNQYLDRDEEKMDQQAGRIRARWYVAPELRTELLLQTSETHTAFWPFQLYKLDDDTRAYLEPFDPDIEDDPYNFRTSFDTPGTLDKGHDTVALNTQWQLGEVAGLDELTSVLVLGYSTFYIDQLNELDVSPADISRLDSHEDHKQLSAELRFHGNAGSLFGLGTGAEFVAGAFFYRSDYTLFARVLAGQDLGSYLLTSDFRQLAGCNASVDDSLDPVLQPLLNPALCSDGQSIPGIPLIGELLAAGIGDDWYQFDYDQRVDAVALFGQLTWELGEHWALTPGLRYSTERKQVLSAGNAHCRQKDAAPDPSLAPPCAMATLLQADNYTKPDLRRSESDYSPKITLQYFANADVGFYASWAKGFKSGGFNAISFTDQDLEYEPENAQTVELGIKSQWFDRTLRINATLYQTKFDNLQVLAFNGVFFDVSNAAAARSKGLEADLMWLTPWEPLTLMASIGLLDARYDEYAGAPAPIRNPETGALQVGAKQDLGGQRIAYAPRATGTLTPVLTIPLGRFVGKLSGDLIYQGDQYTDTDLDVNAHVDPYTLYSARFILSNAEQTWSVSVGGANLTDERVLSRSVDAPFFPGTYFTQQISGRQLFAALSLTF